MMPANKGILYLLPSALSDDDSLDWIGSDFRAVINNCHSFVVEDERSARRFLKRAGIIRPLQEVELQVLNEHTLPQDVSALLKPLLDGKHLGLLSDAGVPAVADPGSDFVRLAHKNDIQVMPLVGPSSILLTLMASGLNGQSFSFNGYLPRESPLRRKRLKELEQRSQQWQQSQLFIETPYRNMQLFDDIIGSCDGNTTLTISIALQSPQQFIKTLTVSEWKKQPSLKDKLHKQPAVFGLLKN